MLLVLNFLAISDDSSHVTLRTRIVPLATSRASFPLVLLAFAALLLAGGCAKRGDTHKEQAHARWNDARARVLLNLANEHYTRGNLVEARKTTTDALRVSNRVAGVFVLAAKLDIEDGNLQVASNSLAAAKELDPTDPEPFYLSGIIAERWQQPEEALMAYQTASQMRPSEQAYLLAHAEALMTLDRAEEAATLLEGRIIFFESSASLRDMLAQVYQELGRHTDAAEFYRQAAVLAPDEPALRERQALALMQAHQWSKAAELLERLIDRPELADKLALHMALAECRMQQGNHAMARAAFLRATRIEPRNHAAWLGLGKASLAADDLQRVQYAIAQAEALRPTGRNAADLALLRGYMHLKQQRPEAAATSFEEARGHDPADPMPLIMYGYCQQQLGNLQRAEQYYNRALELDPEDALARELLSSLASAGTELIQ